MRNWMLILTMLALPVMAQRPRVDNMKAFRQDLAAAVNNGNLTSEEKQKYESAMKTLDEQRAARKSGKQVDRTTSRQAMKDLASVAGSNNLKEEDRAKLTKHLENARNAKGKHGKKKAPAA